MNYYIPFVLLYALSCVSFAEDMPWQTSCGWIDARAGGAKGDGTADDTATLRTLLATTDSNGGDTVYLRDGTYVLTDTWQLPSKRLVLQGQSRAKTVLRLRDHCPGFGDAAKPKPVVSFIGYTDNGLPPNFPKNRGMGQAFCNGVYDLTIDVGVGNPGAIGCYFITNNQGAVSNVRFTAGDQSGRHGLSLAYAWPGPGLFTGIDVTGFDIGINIGQNQYGLVFDGIRLRGQREAGISNGGNLLRIADLDSDNAVPAIRNQGFSGSLVLIDSKLRGSGPAAIVNHGTEPNKYGSAPDCWLPGAWLRDVVVTGYQAAVDSRWTGGSETVPIGSLATWSSHPSQTMQGPGPVRSLHLPLTRAPVLAQDPVESWASIATHGAVSLKDSLSARAAAKAQAKADKAAKKPDAVAPDVAEAAIPLADATIAIQAAIDSGASTVCFPRGLWRVTDTIVIRGKVRRIFGADAAIRTDGFKNTDKPLFRITGEQPVVEIERLHDSYGDCATWIQQDAANTVILRHGIMNGYRNQVPGAKLFVEDICGANWRLDGVTAVGRQWNPETKPTSGRVNIRQRGGTLAILGFKTEYGATVLDADGGAQAEILGGYHYHSSQLPCYLIGDAKLSLAGIVTHEGYTPLVRQMRDGKATDFTLGVYHPVSAKVLVIPGLVRIYGQHLPWFSTETP